MLFEPNPTTLLSPGGSIPVTAFQIHMLAMSGKDLQCGRDPQMNTLIFEDTEWSLSTGRQLLFPESPPFPLRSTAISMRMPSMAFAVDHVLRMATTLSQHATPINESVCRDAQPAAMHLCVPDAQPLLSSARSLYPFRYAIANWPTRIGPVRVVWVPTSWPNVFSLIFSI